jgi:hypothetical protein
MNESNEYLTSAEAAVARAKQIIENNETTVEEFEIHLGGGAYSDSASRDPKPFNGGYTQNHGGLMSAKTNAKSLLQNAWRNLSDMEETSPFVKHADFDLIRAAADYIVEQAEQLGFEL